MDLYRLLYTSEANLPPDRAQHARMLDAIAGQARKLNRPMHLSGVLLHVRGTFIQVLEGPLNSIETVFERICCDFRHRRVKLVDLTPVAERQFGDWTMAGLMQDHQPTRLRVNCGLEEIYFTVNVSAPAALRQMRSLLDRQKMAPGRSGAA